MEEAEEEERRERETGEKEYPDGDRREGRCPIQEGKTAVVLLCACRASSLEHERADEGEERRKKMMMMMMSPVVEDLNWVHAALLIV